MKATAISPCQKIIEEFQAVFIEVEATLQYTPYNEGMELRIKDNATNLNYEAHWSNKTLNQTEVLKHHLSKFQYQIYIDRGKILAPKYIEGQKAAKYRYTNISSIHTGPIHGKVTVSTTPFKPVQKEFDTPYVEPFYPLGPTPWSMDEFNEEKVKEIKEMQAKKEEEAKQKAEAEKMERKKKCEENDEFGSF